MGPRHSLLLSLLFQVDLLQHFTPMLSFPFLSEYSQAKELLCVPVDTTDTLRCFRETLEKSKYHSRSIRHSRKLLSLFLAQTQGKTLAVVTLPACGGPTLRPSACGPGCLRAHSRAPHRRLGLLRATWITSSLSHTLFQPGHCLTHLLLCFLWNYLLPSREEI